MNNFEWEHTYKPPIWLRNGLVNTVFTALGRKVNGVRYQRERLELEDGDFLDLDWSRLQHKPRKIMIALHGLEGSSSRPYIKGMIRYFNQKGWDALGFNFRGCSGEMNRLLQTYHMSKIDDIGAVVRYLESTGNYDSIALVGFSLGGSVVLNYLGRNSVDLPLSIKAAVAISVPVDLVASVRVIEGFKNRPYVIRFLNTLNPKMEEKLKRFPQALSKPDRMPRTLGEFDDDFTAPIHGFKDANDYWEKSSVLRYLPRISRPCLLINARDDSFLSKSCFEKTIAGGNKFFHQVHPKYGGHCGFAGKTNEKGVLWSEQLAFNFVDTI